MIGGTVAVADWNGEFGPGAWTSVVRCFAAAPRARQPGSQMADRRLRAGREVGADGCGEDETVGKTSDDIDEISGPGDISAHHPKCFGKCALDDGEMRWATQFDPAAAATIKADAMDLVQVGERVISIGDIADRGNRSHVAIHAVRCSQMPRASAGPDHSDSWGPSR